MSSNDFKVKLDLRIDWSELDYFGHVNNVSFYKYIQAARVNYWDKIGLTQYHKEINIGPMLASCKCDFKSPLFYPGQIIIYSRINFIKETSFSLIHIIKDHNEIISAEAVDIMVMFDFNTNKKVLFPEEFKNRIKQIEKS